MSEKFMQIISQSPKNTPIGIFLGENGNIGILKEIPENMGVINFSFKCADNIPEGTYVDFLMGKIRINFNYEEIAWVFNSTWGGAFWNHSTPDPTNGGVKIPYNGDLGVVIISMKTKKKANKLVGFIYQ